MKEREMLVDHISGTGTRNKNKKKKTTKKQNKKQKKNQKQNNLIDLGMSVYKFK